MPPKSPVRVALKSRPKPRGIAGNFPGGLAVPPRGFYATTGYNCEQALAAMIPVKKGTLVVYGNRTSTDQVTGFGGGAKRSIGSKMLASQLEGIFSKIQQSQ